eukprot:4575465-Pleurochrysis_carterae.AAC.1
MARRQRVKHASCTRGRRKRARDRASPLVRNEQTRAGVERTESAQARGEGRESAHNGACARTPLEGDAGERGVVGRPPIEPDLVLSCRAVLRLPMARAKASSGVGLSENYVRVPCSQDRGQMLLVKQQSFGHP